MNIQLDKSLITEFWHVPAEQVKWSVFDWVKVNGVVMGEEMIVEKQSCEKLDEVRTLFLEQSSVRHSSAF